MSLHLVVAKSAVKAAAALPDREREAVANVLSGLPRAFGNPHQHAGTGIRKLGPELFEARAGLRTRIVFERTARELRVHLIGGHDAVRRFLRG